MFIVTQPIDRHVLCLDGILFERNGSAAQGVTESATSGGIVHNIDVGDQDIGSPSCRCGRDTRPDLSASGVQARSHDENRRIRRISTQQTLKVARLCAENLDCRRAPVVLCVYGDVPASCGTVENKAAGATYRV
jgi:hypothetical protein